MYWIKRFYVGFEQFIISKFETPMANFDLFNVKDW